MAVTHHKSSVTIRGITYAYGASFVCAGAYQGRTDSEGGGSTATITEVGDTYYIYGYATDDDNGGVLTSYPYMVYTTPSTGRGWYKENIFPYATYTIKYNANGGSGAPSSQTKIHGTNLTLSSTKPTRTGYTFKGWALTSGGSVYYQAGGSCGKNENLTLYAVWEEHKLIINYYSNYATKYSGTATALNTVDPSKNVVVYSQSFFYNSDYSTYGLSNYSNSSGSIYMTRTGYTGTGNWGTTTSGGTLIGENEGFDYGYKIADRLGVLDKLKSGNVTMGLYAQWTENALTVNYYSNYATYGTYKGEELNVDSESNVLVHSQDFLYDNSYSSALSNVQNTSYLYLSRIGYTPTGYWGTTTTGGKLVDEDADYSTGQALAQALGKDISSGNITVNVYPQWQINTYTINYNANGGTGNMNSHTVDWNGNFTISDNTFKREGYKLVGWNAHRDKDDTWYVVGQGWISEDAILEGGYEKKLYQSQEEHVLGYSWVKGNEYTISQYTMYAVWEIAGVVYIDNGTTFEPYLAYIDNGTDWDLYLAYVDDGINWNIIS